MQVTLYPGESVQIEFANTDGQFEIHFDTSEHPNAIIVKETANLTPNRVGAGDAILYHDEFMVNEDEVSDDESEIASDEDDAEETPTGFFMDASGNVHCTAFVHCAILDAGWSPKDGSRQRKVQSLNSEDTVTGEYDFYRTLAELESVSGTKLTREIIA